MWVRYEKWPDRPHIRTKHAGSVWIGITNEDPKVKGEAADKIKAVLDAYYGRLRVIQKGKET